MIVTSYHDMSPHLEHKERNTLAARTTTESSDTYEIEAPDDHFRPKLSAVEVVSIHALLPADSPRRTGEDLQHVHLLSEIGDAPPPITVHRSTMRVLDGMHRLRAAMLRNEQTIRVRFYEGDERDAFVVAVKENTVHGLPLTGADRAAAAARILRSHPHWSDRAIAGIAGLSARTVNDIRRTAFPEEAQSAARLGRDGRMRPLDSSAGRIRAAELIMEGSNASLRQIAQQAGISPGTVRDVRDRLRRGESPLPGSRRTTRETEADLRKTSPLDALIKDPSLRSGEKGRTLLRLLSASASLAPSREQLMSAIPEHCVDLVWQAAKENALAWAKFAEELRHRTAHSLVQPPR
ncbi:ParB/RepB/Spo0J family partition protein [Herbidospora cretacea]|uniref:ParB/RepB/Spo0J family partition protein n=1 Tax=Herbidospora cretacea TaxID=28444 RepID=UPI001E4B2359|nr:ParB N-terminal domain-containing protein [Herbidospora cretacea]